MFCAVFSAINTVSATNYKVIDKGNKYLDFKVKGDNVLKSVWKTQSNGKKIVANWKVYKNFGKKKKNYKIFSNIKITITKINKTKVKVTYINYRTKYGSYSKSTYYDGSDNLSLKSYYYKYYRINFIGQ